MGMDHYCLACAFAVNPARKRAPTGFGVDRSALPSKERAFMPECQIVELAGESNVRCACGKSSWWVGDVLAQTA